MYQIMPRNPWGWIERPTSSTNKSKIQFNSKFIHVFKSTTFAGMAVKSVMKMPSMHNISLLYYHEQRCISFTGRPLRCHWSYSHLWGTEKYHWNLQKTRFPGVSVSETLCYMDHFKFTRVFYSFKCCKEKLYENLRTLVEFKSMTKTHVYPQHLLINWSWE